MSILLFKMFSNRHWKVSFFFDLLIIQNCKILRIVLTILIVYFQINYCVVREQILYYFNPFKFVETCLRAWNMMYFDICLVDLNVYVEVSRGSVNQNILVNSIIQIIQLPTNFLSMWLSNMKRNTTSNFEVDLCISPQFCLLLLYIF